MCYSERLQCGGGDYVFRVKKEEYVNRTFRIPKELLERLEKLADTKEVSLNKLVLQCCEYALENLEEN